MIKIQNSVQAFLLENNIHGGFSTILGDRYVESNENKQRTYIDANSLYAYAVSQLLLPGDFELIPINYPLDEVVEDKIFTESR